MATRLKIKDLFDAVCSVPFFLIFPFFFSFDIFCLTSYSLAFNAGLASYSK